MSANNKPMQPLTHHAPTADSVRLQLFDVQNFFLKKKKKVNEKG